MHAYLLIMSLVGLASPNLSFIALGVTMDGMPNLPFVLLSPTHCDNFASHYSSCL